MSRRDTRRIVQRIPRPSCRYDEPRCGQLIRRTVVDAVGWRRGASATRHAGRRLLRRRQRQQIEDVANRAGDETAVVSPTEGRPRARPLVEDELEVRCRIELLVVVDTELACLRLDEQTSIAGSGEDRVGVRHHEECTESAVLDEVDPAGEAVEVRVIPRDRKDDRCVEEHAEVVGIVGLLLEIAEVRNHPPPDALLDADLELVAAPRRKRHRLADERFGADTAG